MVETVSAEKDVSVKHIWEEIEPDDWLHVLVCSDGLLVSVAFAELNADDRAWASQVIEQLQERGE